MDKVEHEAKVERAKDIKKSLMPGGFRDQIRAGADDVLELVKENKKLKKELGERRYCDACDIEEPLEN